MTEKVFIISRFEPRMEDNNIMEPSIVCSSIEAVQQFTRNSPEYIKEMYSEAVEYERKSFLLGKDLCDMWHVTISDII